MGSLALIAWKMRFFVLVAFIGVAAAAGHENFHGFAKQFKKGYKSMEEYQLRRSIFEKNLAKMVEHNKKYEAGEVTWWMKMNEDMDLTSEEFMAKRTGGIPKYDNTTVFENTLDERIIAKMNKMAPTPRDFNWVNQGMVSSVKNQAQCGSCAAFSAMGAIESCYRIKGDMTDDLSEQHILDCAYNYVVNDEYGSWGAYGCDGAWPVAYVDWVKNNGMNQEESAYPYRSGSSGNVYSCSPSSNGYHTQTRVNGYYNKWYMNEMEMESLIMTNPVSTSLQVTNNWGSYGGGVMNDYSCCNAATDSSCVYNLNHAILVVGYGHDSASGLDYWLIKNSWGTWWGENGYLKLKKGTGHCGVGSLHQTVPYCG